MPDYDPVPWNAADALNVNNCYNYATNNKNTAEPDSGGQPTEKVKPATPGATKDIDPCRPRVVQLRLPDGRLHPCLRLSISCEGLKTAAKVDGVQEEPHCEDNPDCWRIAYFIRNYHDWPGADFHFAREDTPGHWSHKPSKSAQATNSQFNPQTGGYDGPELTDPSAQPVGEGYEFCGYLCVCPDLEVSYHSLEPVREDRETMVAAYKYDGLSGMSPPVVMIEQSDFERLLGDQLEALDEWRQGFGPGVVAYRFERSAPKGQGVQVLFASDKSLTIWDDRLVHLPDPYGTALAKIEAAQWFRAIFNGQMGGRHREA